MDPRERFRRLEELCEEIEALPREERERRLDELEAAEPELFPELRNLLAKTPTTGGLDRIASAAAQLLRDAPTPAAQGARDEEVEQTPELASTVVDRYRLVRLLGVGGMGEVWAAEQSEPVSRMVALKVLRRGFATPGRVARFQDERQALATMDHPNIARVFDGGETPDGQPYFVMELVEDGVPITTYCAHHELGLEQRLQLFVPVCEAVDHAHRKRIIHRDLKPSNVLVTEDAGHPQVKVIDFGIAKPLEELWSRSETHATVMGELVGTPEYMSPEQAALGSVDIDTRSDVFTLGLLLFELIVGDLPVASKELRKLPFDELCRHIREDETPLPSTLLRKAQQQEHPSTLSGSWRRVQGDLDRIVAKALAKDRERRYGSAAELADDLRRFLEHEPVRATPPSGVYRMKKFVRRHRTAMAAATFLLLGLVTGLLVAVEGFRQARAAEKEAIETLAALRGSERFLVDLFREASPESNPGDDLTATEILARGIEQVEAIEQPRVKGRLLWNLGAVQNVRGAYEEAEQLLRRAIELLAVEGKDPLELAAAKSRLASVLRRQSQLIEADRLAAEAIDLLATEPRLEAREIVGGALTLRALISSNQGDHEASEQIYAELIPLLVELDDGESTALPVAQFNRAVNRYRSGDVRSALSALDAPIETFTSRLPESHPNIATLHHTLATWNEEIGELTCAVEHAERSLEIYRQVLPSDHSHIGDSLNGLSITLLALGRVDEAEEAAREAEGIYRRAHGETSWRRMAARTRLAEIALYRSEWDQAATLLEEKLSALASLADNAERRRARAATLRLLAVALRTQALQEVSDGAPLLARAEQHLSEAQILLQGSDVDAEIGAVVLQQALVAAQRGARERARQLLAEAQDITEDPRALDTPRAFQFRAQVPALLEDVALADALLQEAIQGPGWAQWLVRAPETTATGVLDLERHRRRLANRQAAECAESASHSLAVTAGG